MGFNAQHQNTKTRRGALLTAPKMTPWRCSTAVSPTWGPAWLHRPLLLPPLPIAIPTATPSPRARAGIPGVLRLLHHTQQLQQGTPPGKDISDSPLPPLHRGRWTQTIRMICFSRFPSAATRLEHHCRCRVHSPLPQGRAEAGLGALAGGIRREQLGTSIW